MAIDPEQRSTTASLRRRYEIGRSTLDVRFGDLLDSRAEVLVSSDDYTLSMGGGVSRAIRNAGGTAIAVDAAKAGFRELGDVVVTSAGALDARYVFHVVTIAPDGPRHGGSRNDLFMSTAPMDLRQQRQHESTMHLQMVADATSRVLDLARSLEVHSVAFPAVGAGVAGIPVDVVAEGMASAIAMWLDDAVHPINVELWLSAKSWQSDFDYIVFFERIAASLASIAASKELAADERPDPTVRPVSPVLQAERRRLELERQNMATTDAATRDQLAEALAESARDLESALDDRSEPLKLFVSYSRKDQEAAKALTNHLSSLKHAGLAVWSDRTIEAGDDWEAEIHEALETADIGLYLLSADFLASEYCVGREWARAKERQATGDMVMVPVILRACDWQGFIGQLQALPQDARPILSDLARVDEAMVEVVQGVRSRIDTIKRERRAGNGS